MDVFRNIYEALLNKRYTVAAAESCTAGLFSAKLAEIPGASEVMLYGFVVYSEAAKCDLVYVHPETIHRHGVVSEQTAAEMAKGAALHAKAECGIGITGFAGPSADPDYPVGRVCFGFCVNGSVSTETVEFGNIGRNPVREKSALHAAERLLQLLAER